MLKWLILSCILVPQSYGVECFGYFEDDKTKIYKVSGSVFSTSNQKIVIRGKIIDHPSISSVKHFEIKKSACQGIENEVIERAVSLEEEVKLKEAEGSLSIRKEDEKSKPERSKAEREQIEQFWEVYF